MGGVLLEREDLKKSRALLFISWINKTNFAQQK